MKGRLPLKTIVIATFIFTILALFPHLVGPYYVGISIGALWVTYLCVSWTIACRSAAINFCHITFVGAGAYTSTLLFLKLGVSPWLGMLAGMAMALLIALIIGWVCFRAKLQLLSFVLVTLAFGVIVLQFVSSALPVAGGESGLILGFTSNNPWNFQWVSKLPYYYIILGMTLFVVVVYRLIDKSKLGIYSKAISDNERGAAAIGIDITRYKLIALGISAMLAAMAGTFWAQYTTYVEPNHYLGPQMILTLLIFVTIGGIKSNWGPVVAPLFLAPLLDIFRAELGARYTGLAWILYGILVISIILFLPHGIMTWVEEKLRKSSFGIRSRKPY